jgi:hypothetical protein
MAFLNEEDDEEVEGMINAESCQSFDPRENDAPDESLLKVKFRAAKSSPN